MHFAQVFLREMNSNTEIKNPPPFASGSSIQTQKGRHIRPHRVFMCNESMSSTLCWWIHCVGRAKCNIRRFGTHRPSTSTMRARVSMQLLLSANDAIKQQASHENRRQKGIFYDLAYIDAIKHTLRSHVILSIFLLLLFFFFFANKSDCIILVVSKMFASFYFQFGQSTGTCFV